MCSLAGASGYCPRIVQGYLVAGYFECGNVDGKCECITSNSAQAVCFVEYLCYWDWNSTPECLTDITTADDHYSPIKVDRDCK